MSVPFARPHSARSCPRCGVTFECGADRSLTGPCWCPEVEVDAATLRTLSASFTGCLCPPCLSHVARSTR